MDRPKRQVSWLESFLPDIWAYIVWYLAGEDLGRLMMTGATLLCQRLMAPTVVKSIKLGRGLMTFKSFPAFLRDLPSLVELLIDSRNDVWSDKLGLRIDSLPSGLRKLRLSGKWNRSTCKLFGEPGATLRLCQHVPCLETLDLRGLKTGDHAWMTHAPQSLTKLSLDRWKGDVELPCGLIAFTANHVDLSTESFVSKLPSSLESFVVRDVFVGADLVLPLLPHSTRKLVLSNDLCYSVPISSQKLFEQLPNALTCFSVSDDDFDFDFETNPDLISLLPSTLTDLELHMLLPCSAWPLLPQQLKTLYFGAHKDLCTVASTITDDDGTQYQVMSVPFDSLPRTIERLELDTFGQDEIFCGPPSLSKQIYFPPHLTELNIPYIQLSPESAKFLPSTLTVLFLLNFSDRVCPHLPKSLKKLVAYATLLSPQLFKLLPQSLTALDIYPILDSEPWFDDYTGEEIDSAAELAEYVDHEKCLSHSFDWKVASPLPPTLQRFVIRYHNDIGDSFLQHQPLENLLELKMGGSRHFTDLSIPLLSPHLKTLDLERSSSISGESFPFLPRSLTWLSLNSSESIFDSDIQHLPRTLEYAYLENAIHLTDLSIPDLPRDLKELNLRRNQLITPSSLPHFPCSLRSSQSSVQFATWTICWGLIQPYS